MTIEPAPEWWRGAERNWDELVALLKGCSLADQRTGAAARRRDDARVVRRLIGLRRPAAHRPARPLARAA